MYISICIYMYIHVPLQGGVGRIVEQVTGTTAISAQSAISLKGLHLVVFLNRGHPNVDPNILQS